MKSNKLTVGILAHVDAGKTTLAESMLFKSGSIRTLGRVDHKDAFLDTYELERTRGITIFSKQAELVIGDKEVTLLDTPGHVDFSAEMERTLQVLDYAILVVNGADGIQGHVRTLWRLLYIYNIPVFIFINKMDQEGTNRKSLMDEIRAELSDACIPFDNTFDKEFYESIAVCDETCLECYLETGEVSVGQITELINERKVFPCFFGSALRITGVEELMQGFGKYTSWKEYGDEFGAKIYKISRDNQGVRLTHIKITGGSLHTKMAIKEDKVNQIRIYSGSGYKTVDSVLSGVVCAVTGLNDTVSGEGLGIEKASELPMLEPVLVYKIEFPDDCNVHNMYTKLRELEEEEPQLHIIWNEQSDEIHVQVMGEVQIEILKTLIYERFDVNVNFGAGSISYKETIVEPSEGVGHYEPLRHYAEVHLLLTPGERGSGLQFDTDCSEDELARNWQRLVLTHLEEKQHVGVLTGSAITDMKITLIAGRAHLKHTEGGDFRQACYRAVRQGLMRSESILLEPVYDFRIELPPDMIGRAMTDVQKMQGSFNSPYNEGDTAILTGTAPVSCMQGYQLVMIDYSRGEGRLTCTLKGYEECHNSEEVIAIKGYDPVSDMNNPTGSVFCAHGSGFVVAWNMVEQYMHIENRYKPANNKQEIEYEKGQSFYQEPETVRAVSLYGIADKELEDIFVRTYGEIKQKKDNVVSHVSYEDNSTVKKNQKPYEHRENYLLVDGYNIIFSWEELRELAKVNVDGARTRLMDIMCNYQGYRDMKLILVFDAYKVKGNHGEVEKYHNIDVVYTKEAETADQYIEKTVHSIGRKYNVTVATSDALEQVIIFGFGAVRMSAQGLKDDVEAVNKEIRDNYLKTT